MFKGKSVGVGMLFIAVALYGFAIHNSQLANQKTNKQEGMFMTIKNDLKTISCDIISSTLPTTLVTASTEAA